MNGPDREAARMAGRMQYERNRKEMLATERNTRALALQAAATLHAALEPETDLITQSQREDAAHRCLMTARMFEGFIEEGTWASDPEAEVKDTKPYTMVSNLSGGLED